MKKHIYRTLLIWAVLMVGAVNMMPTVGWMMLADDAAWLSLTAEEQEAIVDDPARFEKEGPAADTRQARLLKWKGEDDARAAEKPGYFTRLWHGTKRWAEFDRTKVINLGLDLQGGVHMIIGFDYRDIGEERIKELEDSGFTRSDIEERVQRTVLDQIIRRINQFEAKEPVIQTLGPNQINVQLPGEKDVERAKKLIIKTAQLNFHIVASPDETSRVVQGIVQAFPNRFSPFLSTSALNPGSYTIAADNLERVKAVLEAAEEQGLIPEDKLVLFSQPPKAYEEDKSYRLYLLDKEPIQSGDGLTKAYALPDPSNPPMWQISFEFNNAAGAHFGEVTKANMQRLMAIVMDDVVVSAATIQGQITTRGQITGSFDGAEALDLSIALDSGSMIVDVHEEYTGVVGPSLGAAAVHSGVRSALVGIALVGVFMLFYYHIAGVIAVIGLALNAVLVVAAMAYFDMTLTLPGIAGLILTVGMAVDANVLIFERIREERKLGHSLASSVENGFARATTTILDANVTTLIAAAVLMEFGTGPIEGFAITLSVGVCTSVFAALVLSRAMFDFVVEKDLISKVSMLSIIKEETQIPFLSARTKAAFASVAVILAGAGLFGYHLLVKHDMLGVDFTKGTNARVVLKGSDAIEAGEVRAALVENGFEEPIVQLAESRGATEDEAALGDTLWRTTFVIRVSQAGAEEVGAESGDDASAADAADTEDAAGTAVATVDTRLQEVLASLTGGDVAKVEMLEVQTVGAAVASQLGKDAIWAMFFSLLFIVAYLAFRFEPKYAVGAVVALMHDVLITVGLLALFDRPITMPVIAAIMTIIGYSLNDTIVVFDRIREDIELYRGKGMKFTEILDIAINRTLSRTLLTSITTLFVVGVLYLFGGPAINTFALALIIGVAVGTYSSIFIASPVVYAIQVMRAKHAAQSEAGAGEGRYIKSKKRGKKNTEEAEA